LSCDTETYLAKIEYYETIGYIVSNTRKRGYREGRKKDEENERDTKSFCEREQKNLTFKLKLHLCPLDLIFPKNKNKGVCV
jgi:hypothetical protein